MGLTERECWFWMASCEWMGVRSAEKLLGYFKSAKNIYYGRNSQYEKVKGLNHKILTHLKAREIQEDQIKRGMDLLDRQGGKFVCRIDLDYPTKLRHIHDAPLGLFYYGKLPDEKQPLIAMVGAREASGYGLEAARYFSRKLAENGVGIMSGLARGVDGEAHKGALQGGGETWGVLGCGINICYPKENFRLYEQMKTRGGILSEYGNGSKPEAWHFPLRNRIISGLADGIFVVEAREHSGSLITVDLGLEQGKNIYALPGSFHASLSRGCHQLIQNGAKLVYRPEDILEDFHIAIMEKNGGKEKIKLSLDKSEQLVYSSLSLGPKDVESISIACNLPLTDTIQILMHLEIEGKIQSMGQNQYMLKL